MHKNILKKDYPLSAKSEVTETEAKIDADLVTGDELTFTWGHPWTDRDTKVSKLLELVENSHIKMKWDYQEDDPDAYWEMRIEKNEFTGNLTFLVTDYADPEDINDLSDIWDANMERFHRITGFLL